MDSIASSPASSTAPSGRTPSLADALNYGSSSNMSISGPEGRENWILTDASGRLLLPAVSFDDGQELPPEPLDNFLVEGPQMQNTPTQQGTINLLIDTGDTSLNVPTGTNSSSITTPGGSDLEAQELSILFDAAVPTAPQVRRLNVPTGYPDPASVFDDTTRSARLIASGILDQLASVDPSAVLSSGSRHLDTAISSVNMSSYDQLIFAYAAKYYSTLPDISYDERTIQFLHMCTVYSRSPRLVLPESYHSLRDSYNDATTCDVIHIVIKVAQFILKEDTFTSPTVESIMPARDLRTLISDLRNRHPIAFYVYRMIYQLVHGGPRCIEPIPELVRENDNLALYIDKIGQGNNIILMSQIGVEPRPPNLPIFQPDVPAPVQVPTDVSSLAPVAAAASARVESPVIMGFPVPASQPRLQRNAPNSLMVQGEPSRVQHIRSTTSFRESVLSDAGVREMHSEILNAIAGMNAKLSEIQEQLSSQSSSITVLDRTVASLISQQDFRDLRARSAVNRTLLQSDSTSVQTMIDNAPPIMTGDVALLHSLADRLDTITHVNQDPALIDDIRGCLTRMGQTNTAANLVEAGLSTQRARGRWSARLRSMA